MPPPRYRCDAGAQAEALRIGRPRGRLDVLHPHVGECETLPDPGTEGYAPRRQRQDVFRPYTHTPRHLHAQFLADPHHVDVVPHTGLERRAAKGELTDLSRLGEDDDPLETSTR